MKKKNEIPMPKIKSTTVDLINKKTKFYTVVAAVGIIGILCVAFLARKESKEAETVEYIQKGVVTNYVCKIVGAEPEENVVAVQCFTK